MTQSRASWATEAPEYQIKAAYLYNFCKFTEWPPPKSTVPGAPSPFYVCLVGGDPFRGSLEKLVAGRSVGNRPLKVRQTSAPQEFAACDVLYVSATSEKNVVADALKSALANRVLSIGDVPDFIERGGDVRLFAEEGHVTFEVNLSAIEKAGLRIDARVLNLAAKIWR